MQDNYYFSVDQQIGKKLFVINIIIMIWSQYSQNLNTNQ